MQLLVCSMSSSDYLFGLNLIHLYLSMPIGGKNSSWVCCAMGGPIGNCVIGPMMDLGAEGISWMKDCLWLWLGWMMLANLCSCSIFLFIKHFLSHRITRKVRITKLSTSRIVSIDSIAWELLEILSKPTFVFSSRLPAVLVDRALLHILNTNGYAGVSLKNMSNNHWNQSRSKG